jgi:predicted Fe-S protein YdhL (DUF1289 family)
MAAADPETSLDVSRAANPDAKPDTNAAATASTNPDAGPPSAKTTRQAASRVVSPLVSPLMSPLSSPVTSPCNNVCTMDPLTGWCVGCWRTLDEIAEWSVYSDDEKRDTWARIDARRSAPGTP